MKLDRWHGWQAAKGDPEAMVRALQRELRQGVPSRTDLELLRAQIEAHVERRLYLVLGTQVAGFIGLALLILLRT
jgi:hypothetical protein